VLFFIKKQQKATKLFLLKINNDILLKIEIKNKKNYKLEINALLFLSEKNFLFFLN